MTKRTIHVRCLYGVDNERLWLNMMILACPTYYSTRRTTTDKMDRFLRELLHHILGYIDQPLDIFRMSCVCSRWRSFIMDDNEYFLNQWFSRSLERSRKSYSCVSTFWDGDCKPMWKLNLDQSLFPINLQSSICDFFPWIVSKI